MRFRRTTHVLFCVFTAGAIAQASDDGRLEAKPDAPAKTRDETPAEGLSMSSAQACRSIDGFEDYEPLPVAALTADEKLLVYYRPFHYRIEKVGNSNHVHLTQDGQIRRRGEKRVLLRKEKLLEYEVKTEDSAGLVFLKNTVSLKGLKPGEYEFDIILHDKLAKSQVATQSLPFRVVAASLPKEDGKPDPAEGRSSSPSPK
jgi:hypothetical protein